ncbi:MAG: hypothetical protein AAF993_00730 [Pseudomonadota bacterium]
MHNNWAEHYVTAIAEQQPFASASTQMPELDISGAYQLQRECVNLLGKPVSGYKAALTATPAQNAMGINTPIVGALTEDGELAADQTHTLQRQALMETEFGYRLNTDIHSPVETDRVMQLVASCHPMLEIASPNLSQKPSGIDLIATNSAAFGYVVGTAVDPLNVPVDDIEVSLRHNDELCFSGRGADVMGGQAAALTWLINQVLAIGYPLRRGHLLMTGSIGAMQPIKGGRYEGHFAGLGVLRVNFT